MLDCFYNTCRIQSEHAVGRGIKINVFPYLEDNWPLDDDDMILDKTHKL